MNLKITTSILTILAVLFIIGINANNINERILMSFQQDNFSHRDDVKVTSSEPSLSNDDKIKIKSQNSLFSKTLNQLDNGKKKNYSKYSDNSLELAEIENSRIYHVQTKKVKLLDSKTISSNQYTTIRTNLNHQPKENIKSVVVAEINFSDIDEKTLVYPELEIIEFISQKKHKDIETKNSSTLMHIGYWQTVHSIESKQGKLLYRPRNKSRNCTYTTGPCGHHQLTVKALKDIGCNSKQCRKDRLNYKKSLKLSKKLLALNEKRLKNNGISKLKDYQKYLIHQQGAYGIKNIIAANKGYKELTNNIKKNMANNSPYSYKQLKSMGSKAAANKFLQHWEIKWHNEKRLIVASQGTTSTDNQKNTDFIPAFDENELLLAFNVRF